MIALRFTSLFFLAATLASASPASAPTGLAIVDKRASTADVETVFTTLKSSTDSILPQIDALVSSGTASDATVAPLIGELAAALNTATASLSSLPISSKRQTENEVATVVAGIITEISTTLNGLSGSPTAIPAFGTLIIAIDVALDELLVGLDVVLTGVVTLVAGLLVSVAVLLGQLGLGLVIGSLGL
ncbi:hypothetical protein B0H17DRAFT_1231542 [Mycena rosella]|uniref:Sc15 protein n=1 Tax=Mycena rosella TaxID=1033263 RepID=A0AAD7M6J1_MYCRO|nr:hypothetical protein B0H17DRAFT_1231542 [Mycena rosella]